VVEPPVRQGYWPKAYSPSEQPLALTLAAVETLLAKGASGANKTRDDAPTLTSRAHGGIR